MLNSNQPENLYVAFNEFKIFTSLIDQNYNQSTLMIHGGARNHELFHPLRQWLANELQIGSIAFDCIGHGLSEGQLSDSSLFQRTQQAIKVIQHSQKKVTSCIGVSMGAYNALQLSQQLAIDTLILIIPGIYTPSAYHVNFGKEFSKIIRSKNSWNDSDAWDILRDFKGKLLIISAENDEVVPSSIPEKLYESAINTEWKHHMIVPNAIHKKFMEYLWNNEKEKECFLNLLKHCVSI